jgi:thioredoxin-related protein
MVQLNNFVRFQVVNVGKLGLNKKQISQNMFNDYESIAEANKTLNMIMIGSTTCLIYQGYQELGY